MAKVIYKYTLNQTHREQLLACPAGAAFIAFQYQNEQPRVWAEVEPQSVDCDRRLQIVGTGGEVPERGVHIGTWQSAVYVWHLYEIEPPPTEQKE